MRKLTMRAVEKTWGRDRLPDLFSAQLVKGKRIGEILFESDGDQARLPLLVKYLFTSEALSIQVHPGDAYARRAGFRGGKEEAWYILDCAPDACIGLGLTRAVSSEHFRSAALDGSLVELVDWRPVQPGDCYFVPAGTVHAIGAGITLVEVQQNVDVTFRLFDYGRPRELHLEAGLAVSCLEPYPWLPIRAQPGQRACLVSNDAAPFRLDMVAWENDNLALPALEMIWFIPLKGSGEVDGQLWRSGDVWLIDQHSRISALKPSAALIAAPA